MSSKLKLSGLKKRLGNIEKRQDDLGCNERFIPLYNGLECNRLAKSNERTKKEIELKAAAAKKAATDRMSFVSYDDDDSNFDPEENFDWETYGIERM